MTLSQSDNWLKTVAQTQEVDVERPLTPRGQTLVSCLADECSSALRKSSDLSVTINTSDAIGGRYRFKTGSGGTGFTTLVRSVAADPDDIMQSSIQYCSWDVGGVAYTCK